MSGDVSADYDRRQTVRLSGGRCMYCGEVEPRLPCPMCRPAPDDGDDTSVTAPASGDQS